MLPDVACPLASVGPARIRRRLAVTLQIRRTALMSTLGRQCYPPHAGRSGRGRGSNQLASATAARQPARARVASTTWNATGSRRGQESDRLCPPITTTAIARRSSGQGRAECQRQHAADQRQRRHQDRPQPIAAGFEHGGAHSTPCARRLRGLVDLRIAFLPRRRTARACRAPSRGSSIAGRPKRRKAHGSDNGSDSRMTRGWTRLSYWAAKHHVHEPTDSRKAQPNSTNSAPARGRGRPRRPSRPAASSAPQRPHAPPSMRSASPNAGAIPARSET